ncbi:TIGR00266 family protein [Rhizobium laguerreae]|uniref:TIGR00266 family protein n=1 Tax=Rhizobium laguerreae TaxID=1076926 RepID=UPI001C900926|nr:TIGR00266 family protein [Rhizobium laguerreae]MBY3157317.1 TIGR00266 family protein [Rhizobium laguerreae]
MKLDIVGQSDNFLYVTLERGEEISCESGAMAMMEGNLDLVGEMKGGFFSALGRKLTNGESFFTQTIRATRGGGEALLSPVIPGDIHVLECGGPRQYYLNDGVFLASEKTVDVKVRTQSIGRALLGGTGGFFVGQTEGRGKLAVSGFGTVLEMDIDATHGNPVTIDNSQVVAWDAGLSFDIAMSTNRSSGFLGSLVNSAVSGEGVVCKFSGQGKVVICSRNRDAYFGYLTSKIGSKG